MENENKINGKQKIRHYYITDHIQQIINCIYLFNVFSERLLKDSIN